MEGTQGGSLGKDHLEVLGMRGGRQAWAERERKLKGGRTAGPRQKGWQARE